MSENSNANAAALRREARRRRILENSESRLRSITGKFVDPPPGGERGTDTCSRTHFDEFADGYFNNLSAKSDESVTAAENVFDRDLMSSINEHYVSRQDTRSKSQQEVQKSSLDCLIEKRIHYAILPVVVRFLLLCKLGYFFYNNIFCPFLTLKVVELVMHKSPQPKPTNFLTILASVYRGSTLAYLCTAYTVITMLISDFFLYMFTFIISDKLCSNFT